MSIEVGELGDLSQRLPTYFSVTDEFSLPLNELQTGDDGGEPNFCTSGRIGDHRLEEMERRIADWREFSRDPTEVRFTARVLNNRVAFAGG